MEIKRFINSVFESNTFVIHECGEAVIVDIGDPAPVIDFIDANGLNPEALFITHTHYDHIYGVRELMRRYPEIPVYTSMEGKMAFAKTNWNFSRYHDDPIEIKSDRIIELHDGDRIEIMDGTEVEVIATPGHDFSCLTYRMEDKLFTGDSFIPGVKVVATFIKSDKRLAKEWYERLEKMSAEYDIYPGHKEIQFRGI